MNKFLLGTVACGSLLAMTGLVSAADLAARPYTKAPAIVASPAFDWSGFYIGGYAGYGWAREDHSDLVAGGGFWTFGPAGIFGGTQRISPAGAVYGGQGGYNWQAGNWVFGVEVAGGGASIDKTDISIFFPATDRLKAKIDSTFTGTGRIGYAFNNWLPYIKGGYAGAQLNVTNFDIFGSHLDDNKWRNGYVIGAGLEYGFARNWIIGIEYNYMDFGTESFAGNRISSQGAVVPFIERFDDKLTLQTVTARLSYKFGGGPVVARY
jgi:outer membrane immunogenic protein